MNRSLALTSLVLATACGGNAASGKSMGSESTDAETTAAPESTATHSDNGAAPVTPSTSATTSPLNDPSSSTPATTSASTGSDTSASANSPSAEFSSSAAPTTETTTEVFASSSAGDAGTVTGPEGSNETSTALSFATDIWPLWLATREPVFVYRGMGSYTGCADETAPCHGSQTPGAQLSMADADTAYAQMMATPSVSGLCAGSQRVVVGDPENSCLIQFYVGRLGKEDLDWVDDAEIDLMRQWIAQGALP